MDNSNIFWRNILWEKMIKTYSKNVYRSQDEPNKSMVMYIFDELVGEDYPWFLWLNLKLTDRYNFEHNWMF